MTEIMTISLKDGQKQWVKDNKSIFTKYGGFSGWVQKLIDIKRKKEEGLL